MRYYKRRLTMLLTLTICLSAILMACQTPTATAVPTWTAGPSPTATPMPAPTEPTATSSPASTATPLAEVAAPPTRDPAFEPETTLPSDFPVMDLLLADSEGHLMLHHLPEGTPQPLTDAEAFHPGMARPLWTPPRRSPDGAYWLLPQPNGLGTWLVSPREALARKIDDRSLNTAWAPTGDRFVCAWESDHFIFDVHGVAPDDGPEYVALRGAVIGREGEFILALAWSPVADQTALLVKSPDAGPSDPALRVLLSGPVGGAIRSLGTVPVKAGESTAFDLAWSPDGQTVDFLGDVAIPDAIGVRLPVDESEPEWIPLPDLPEDLALIWHGHALSAGTGTTPPVHSPDGSRFVWSVVDREWVTLWQQPVDASTPAEIVAELPAPVRYLVWTPDGRFLIAAGGWNAYAPIWAVNVERGMVYRIADEALLLSLPPASLRPPSGLFDGREF